MKSNRLKTSLVALPLVSHPNQSTGADLTPMLDTIFLIILLLLATLMHSSVVRGYPVNCPSFAEHAGLQKENQALEVSIDKEGQIYVGKDRVLLADLPNSLKTATDGTTSEKILVRGDRETRYGQIAEVLAHLSRHLPDKHIILVSQTERQSP